MKRALLLEPTELDTSQLVAWGMPLVLFPAGCVSAHSDSFKQRLLERLDEIEYDEHRDAFVVTGKASKVARACAVLCSTYASNLVFLYWNDVKKRYSVIEDGAEDA